MKNVITAILLISAISAMPAFAVDPSFVWERAYDSGNEDGANAVAIDPEGNILVSGSSDVAENDDEFHLIKYDPEGNELWHKTRNPGMYDMSLGVAIDSDGNSYTCGGFNLDFYLMKFDIDGNFVWEKSFDAGGNERAYSVACDASDNVWMSGVNFTSVKYDPSGNVLWSDTDPLFGCGYGLAAASDASVYIAGYTGAPSDIEVGVNKLDSQGNVVWNKTYGSPTTSDFLMDIAVDKSNNLYFTGASYEPPDGPSDAVTYRLDPDGNVKWQKTYDSGNDETCYGIAVDDYFVYAVGSLDNGTDDDLLILRFQKNGALDWTVTRDWGGDDEYYAIASDNKGNVYVAGETDLDFYVVKYHQSDFPGVVEKTNPESSLSLDAIAKSGSSVTLAYFLGGKASGSITLYSVEGRLVKTFSVSSSDNTLTWDASSMPSGVYFARLTAGANSLVRKIVLTR